MSLSCTANQTIKSLNNYTIEYNIAKSTISQWVKQYHDKCQYTTPEKADSAAEIRKINQRIKEQEKELGLI